MHVYLGADHAGLELKHHLHRWVTERGHQVTDCGPLGYDPADDYPRFVLRAAEAVAGKVGSMGIVIGGSGNGETMAANKVDGIRAALVWSEQIAVLARAHNDANVIGLGARMHSVEEATRLVEVFLSTSFSGDERHRRRIAMLGRYETTGELPPLP